MPQKKFTEKFVGNPLQNKNVGRRTGKDMKAGKNIRKIAGGFENFDDYWSESEADMTQEGTFVKPNPTGELPAKNKEDSADVPLQRSSPVAPVKHPNSVPSDSVQSQKFTEKSVGNPLQNKNVGRRTGKDMKAGKNIRKIAGGFENFDDYWSESEADMTREGTFVKPNPAGELPAKNKEDSADVPLQQSSPVAPEKHPDSVSSILVQSQIGNVQPVEKLFNPVTGKYIGRHTGKDMKAGKNIRILEGGFENFDDYWSESDADSVASLSAASRASKRSSGPAKHESSASITQQESSGPQKRSSNNKKVAGRRDEIEDSGQDKVKITATIVPDQVTHKDTPAADCQADKYTSEDADSQKGRTTSGDKQTCEESSSQEDDNVCEGEVSQEEEDVIETKHQQGQEDKLVGKQGRPASAQNHETQSENNEISDRTNSHVIQLHTDSAVSSHSSAASSKTSTKASKQQSSVLAIEESSGSAKQQSSRSSTQLPKESARKETEPMNYEGGPIESETEQSEDTSGHEKSNGRELGKGESSSDKHGREHSEETGRGSKKTIQEKMNYGDATKKLPVSSLEAGDSKRKEKETGKVKHSSSQQSSADDPQPLSSEQNIVTLPQSDSVGNNTEISQSQINATASPKATSQKSSVYLSIAGDVTGSITQLSNSSAVSPEPKLFGARKRLSYAESPKKAEQPKARKGIQISRLPRPVLKTSIIKPLSFPIPEHHMESLEDSEKDHISPTQPGNIESLTNKQSSAQLKGNPAAEAAKKNLTADTTKKHQQSAQLESEMSQDSPSEVGMFVSLASQSQNRVSTVHPTRSDSEDDHFQIVDESKIHRTPAGRRKSSKTVTEKGRDKIIKIARRQLEPSVGSDEKSFQEDDRTQHRQTNKSASWRHVTESKCLSLDEADRDPSSDNTHAQVKKKKVEKKTNIGNKNKLVTVNVEDRDISFQDEESELQNTEKIMSAKKRRKSLGEDDQEPSTDTWQETPVAKEKSRKVSEKKSSASLATDQSDILPKRSRENSPPVKGKGKRKTLKKTSVAQDDDDENPSVEVDSDVSTKKRRKKSPPVKGRGKRKNLIKPATVQDDDNESPLVVVGSQHEEAAVESKRGRKRSKVRKANECDENAEEEVETELEEIAVGSKPERKKRSKVQKASEDDDHNPLVDVETQHEEAAIESKCGRKRGSKLRKVSDDDETPSVEVEIQREEAAVGSKPGRRRSKVRKASEKNPIELVSLEQKSAADNEASTQHRSVRKARKTKAQADQETRDLAEGRENKQDQSEGRKKRSKKSETNFSNIEKEQARSVKATKRSKESLSRTSQKVSPAKKTHRSSAAVGQLDAESDMENEEEETTCTPVCHTLPDMSTSDSALKSGISFRHFSHVPSSLKTKRSRQLIYNTPEAVEEDIISSPVLVTSSHQSLGASPLLQSSRPAQTVDSMPVSRCLTSKLKGDSAKRKKGRRVTISDNVTHHDISPEVLDIERSGDMSTTVLPSMSTTPVHYHQLSTPNSSPQPLWTKNKIVHPDDGTSGLRRSHRTRVKPIEWYKNERIVYDRRDSGPVIVGIEPSREHIYLEQEKLKRRKRRQKLLAQKKRQSTRGRLAKRLSTHVPLPKNLDITVSTDIPVIQPDTREEVLMGCFNPAAKASVIGPSGNSPLPGDPFNLKLITEQGLFTTGVLTLAPASEKPLQRTMSTAVLYVITYGKILVTINRATTVLQTGDHFFVPRGTVYKLKNLREEEASLSFTNLMVDKAETSVVGQPS